MAIDKNGVEHVSIENKVTVDGEASTLTKQSSGNFIEDEGGIWGLGVDGAKCGCSDDAKRNCIDTANGDANCGAGGDGGNFIEDEGGIWGIGVDGAKCGCSDPSQEGVATCGDGSTTSAGARSSCGHVCGTCTDDATKSQACSKNHQAALYPVNAAMSPLVLSEDGDRGKIFFASESGTTKRLAEKLLQKVKECNLPFDLVDPASYEPEDLPKEKLVVVVASTWEDGKAPKNAAFLAQWLDESSEDFRVGSGILRECRSDFALLHPSEISVQILPHFFSSFDYVIWEPSFIQFHLCFGTFIRVM